MIHPNNPESKTLELGLVNFFYPFKLEENKGFYHTRLLECGWIEWKYEDKINTADYYDGFTVRDYDLKQYFIDYTEKVLFSSSPGEHTFQRYSKVFNKDLVYEFPFKDKKQYRVKFISADVFLCGMEIGFVVLKFNCYSSGDKQNKKLYDFIQFIENFRILKVEYGNQILGNIKVNGQGINVYEFIRSKEVLPKELFPIIGVKPFSKEEKQKHQEPLRHQEHQLIPYIYNPRMLVQAFVSVNGGLDSVDRFMIANIDSEFASANNMEFINEFNEKQIYNRWMPESFYSVIDYAVTNIVDRNKIDNCWFVDNKLPEHFYGCYYYMILLQLFYKSALMKLSYEYSKLDSNDLGEAKELLKNAEIFQQHYYYANVTNQVQGIEMWNLYSNWLGNIKLFTETKKEIDDVCSMLSAERADNMNSSIKTLTFFALIVGLLQIFKPEYIKDLFRQLFNIKLKGQDIDFVLNIFTFLVFFVVAGYLIILVCSSSYCRKLFKYIKRVCRGYYEKIS